MKTKLFQGDTLYIHSYKHTHIVLYDAKLCQIAIFNLKLRVLRKFIYIKVPDDFVMFKDDTMHMDRYIIGIKILLYK